MCFRESGIFLILPKVLFSGAILGIINNWCQNEGSNCRILYIESLEISTETDYPFNRITLTHAFQKSVRP